MSDLQISNLAQIGHPRTTLTIEFNSLVFNTGEPAYAVDRSGKIVAWNEAAVQTFGFSTARALGSNCWELLQGQDVYGNAYCGRNCPHREMAFRRQSIKLCRMRLKTASGEHEAFTMSNLAVFNDSGREILIHLCRQCSEAPAQEGEANPGFNYTVPGKTSQILTPRETEVLRALSDGRSTREMATLMSISMPTVRNHIEHILHKLHCHSRLEAVAVARRLKLV
jgi:DNA-binding CsgD family transcriptional regulator